MTQHHITIETSHSDRCAKWGRRVTKFGALCTGGSAVQFQTPTPAAWVGPEGGEGIFSILGAFLNSLFHSERFEYTQVG